MTSIFEGGDRILPVPDPEWKATKGYLEDHDLKEETILF